MDIYKKAKELIELMKDVDLDEIEIKDGVREIRLTKHSAPVLGAAPSLPVSSQAAVPGPASPSVSEPQKEENKSSPHMENTAEFKSPMVGTFYRAPSPESPPYSTEGDKVNKDTVICIIEAMKVMNEIKAEMEGEILEILVENGEAVEFGQPLFLIRKK